MKRILAIIMLAALMLTLFVGCGGGADTQAPATAEEASAPEEAAPPAVNIEESDTVAVAAADGYLRDKVTVAISGDGKTFDPFTPQSSWGKVKFPLFQLLAEVDSKGEIRYVILKSFTEIDDMTYEGEIWDCVYDTAGNNITAADVVWSIQKFIDSGNKGGVNRLESLEVSGDYTFIWHCSEPFGPGDMGKNLSNCSIVCRETYEAMGPDGMASEPICTGPYMLKEYVPGSSVTLVANEDYWMKHIPDQQWLADNNYATGFQNVREIEYQIIQDAGSRAIALEMGTVDAVDSMNAADVDYFIQNPDLGVIPVELPQDPPVAFYFDCNEASPCSDVKLRQAICYAIDNAAVAEGLEFPAQPAYGMQPRMYDAPESWTTGEGRDYYTYNVETAKALLAESSYNGETLTIMYMNQPAITDAVILVQDALKQVGITVDLLPADISVLNDYKLDFTKWDMMFDIMGGGNYLSTTLKKFWTEDSASTMNGLQVTGILDSYLDELFVALKDDTNDATISAWDEYFTDEMCYGYALCLYSNQTACQADVNCVITGAQRNITPQAFTFTD